MVEYARTRFMSRWTTALQAAMSMVVPPMTATANWTAGASVKRTCVRAIRYTPAVTMVAA